VTSLKPMRAGTCKTKKTTWLATGTNERLSSGKGEKQRRGGIKTGKKEKNARKDERNITRINRLKAPRKHTAMQEGRITVDQPKEEAKG